MNHKILQGNYSSSFPYYQVTLPITNEHLIAEDDPVRLLDACVEDMELSALYRTYERIPRNTATPRQLLKIVLYGYMNGIRSTRDLEKACRKNIDYMFLLGDSPVPDHTTIARFITLHLSQCIKRLYTEQIGMLVELNEISGETVFIDGTKIEAYANKYTFVWKKAVTKNLAKLLAQIPEFLQDCEEQLGQKLLYSEEITVHTLKRIQKEMEKVRKIEGIEFVHGPGRRKSPLQKMMEQLDEYLQRLGEYNEKLRICGERNSFSKTDHDATFMRMKEDAMSNGQLKPAYNVQHAVDSEYIVWVNVSAHCTDTMTLKPVLEEMKRYLPFQYTEVVADAGYESEENYLYLDENGQIAFIKPQNYEISKKKEYRNDISRKENMLYDEKRDVYICRNSKELSATSIRRQKTKSGYVIEDTVYQCASCSRCRYKRECIKGNNCKTPMKDRSKVLYVAKKREQFRKDCMERLLSDRGVQLRMNRSIQVEGSFAVIKEDMNFRQYSYRGKENVLTQSMLMAMAFNINKLHHKIQNKRTGTHLFEVAKTA